MHVKVETSAPPAVAYQRVAGVLGVLAELLQPVGENNEYFCNTLISFFKIKDTHIDGITTEPNPNLEGGEGGEGDGEANGSEELGGGGGPSEFFFWIPFFNNFIILLFIFFLSRQTKWKRKP